MGFCEKTMPLDRIDEMNHAPGEPGGIGRCASRLDHSPHVNKALFTG